MSDRQAQYDQFLEFKTRKRWAEGGFPTDKVYMDRLEYELKIIRDMKFSSYFLIMSDLCDFMRREKIRFLARGSGCGSVVIWALGVSHRWIDPIQYDLPFERFLNPARISMPDIDVDMDDQLRDKVFFYTGEKYGWHAVSKIVTFGTLAARMAIRDAGRILKNDIQDADKLADEIAALIPGGKGDDGKNVRIRDAVKASELLQSYEKRYPQMFKIAGLLEGRVRNPGVHAAGTVITPTNTTDYMPVMYWGDPAKREGSDNFPTAQYDMYDMEERKHLKMDYLGLRTLRVIEETQKMIRSMPPQYGGNPNFDIDNVDRHDGPTFDLLDQGKTACVFQIERQFVRPFAKRMGFKKRNPESLSALVALIRPGTMDCGATELYLKRANGEEPVVYEDPRLEEVLKDTYGIILYQEQVMKLCVVMAGYSMSEADGVRKLVGKKIADKLQKEGPKFVARCVERGWNKEVAEKVWSQIVTFGFYGFNRSHSGSYGMVGSYQTGYLKANHALPFMCCMINSEAGYTDKEMGYNYKVAEYVEESRMMGLHIIKPSIRFSDPLCTIRPDKNAIIFGLKLIKGVSEKGVQWIMSKCRNTRNLKEFMLSCYEVELDQWTDQDGGKHEEWTVRTRVSKSDVEGLIDAGALDEFVNGDRDLAMALSKPLRELGKKYWERVAHERNGKRSNKGNSSDDVFRLYEDFALPDESFERRNLEQLLDAERSSTGCYLSQSPFLPFRSVQDECNCTPDEIMDFKVPYDEMVFVGLVQRFREITIKKGKNAGNKMGFIGVVGTNGSQMETVAFSDAWAAAAPDLEVGKIYRFEVNYDRSGNGVIVRNVHRLSRRTEAA